jgi:hypothetical protein
MPLGAFRQSLNLAGIVEPPAAVRQTISTVGAAQVSTTQVKFGTGSLTATPSNANGLTSTLTNFPASNYTIEFWVYLTSANLGQFMSNTDGGSLFFYDSGSWTIYSENANYSKNITYTMTLNAWHHVALVNASGTFTLYVDGVARGTTWTQASLFAGEAFITSTKTLALLGTANGFSGITGYMDEIRISSVARYTSTFTLATAAFTNDSNTLLLIHADGANNSTVFTDDNSPPTPLLTFVGASYVSGATTIAMPSGAAEGDIVFVIDRLAATGSLTLFRTPLSSAGNSFTAHQTTSGGTSTTFLGCRISSRVLVAGELGTITNLINNATTSAHRTIAVAFRPSSAITSVTYTQTGGQYTTGDPSVQTVTVSAEPSAALAMALYTALAAVAPRTSSITMNELVESGVTTFYAKYKLYANGESRTNFTVDMDDEGTNLMQSFYVKFN